MFEGFSFLDREKIAAIAREAGSVNSLTPDTDFFGNDTFVSNLQTGRNYTAKDFPLLYEDLKTPITAIIHNRTNTIINDLTHPSVPTYCLYGNGVQTEESYVYQNFSTDPKKVVQPSQIFYTFEGDGTVPLLSLGQCKKWATETNNLLKCREYKFVKYANFFEVKALILTNFNFRK